MKPQVLIVGAGPVGLTMAVELSRYGLAVRIVDKSASRTDKSKAIVLWSRTLELLDRTLGTDRFIAAGHKVDAASIMADRRLIGHIDFADVESPYPYALMLPQSDTERLLEEHLQTVNIKVERNTEVVRFEQNEHGVKAVLRDANGAEELVETDWLIGCDGAHSTVRHGLNLPFLGETLQSDWILADIHLKGYPFAPSQLAIYWHEDGVLAVFPMSATRFRVIADLGLSKGASPGAPTIDQVQAIIDRRGPGGIVASDSVWLSGFRINERKVGNYRFGRVFVAGDAAHVHSPAGGQGMNTGMQDAFNLAWKLALVCQGACAESLLDSYTIERSAIGDQVLQAAGRLTMVATMRNHTAQAVRNLFGRILLGLTSVRKAMVSNMTEVSVGYDQSPLNGVGYDKPDLPRPGSRLQPVLGQTPVGSGDLARFALFAENDESTARFIGRHADLVDKKLRPPLKPGKVVLVRPDGYVACVAKAESLASLGDYLGAIRAS